MVRADRLYLIKQVLEGSAVTRSTQLHLDRCLTLPELPDHVPERRRVRSSARDRAARSSMSASSDRTAEQALRGLLKEGLRSPLFAPALRLGRMLRPWLPAALRNKVPADRAGTSSAAAIGGPQSAEQPRKILMLQGCVQPSLMPQHRPRRRRVLAAAGIQMISVRGAPLLRRFAHASRRSGRRPGGYAA